MITSRVRVTLALVYAGLALNACTPQGVATAPAPAPVIVTTATAPSPAAAPQAPVGARTPYRTAPADWHLLDPASDGVVGVGARRAMTELLGNAAPKRMITVAVIDGGVDTAHTTLRGALYLNARETPANGRDDDANGYVDDARGWNFIGGASGNLDDERLELTRLVAQCRANSNRSAVRTPCTTLEREFTAARADAVAQWAGLRPVVTGDD
ncbi:MAG: hypothetical protein H7305_05150, partial [Gemmatimonadaceae bacterium]|nr:hypothetical protein [Gemmatimonadaceae bacterium]